jgi:hypothetical protein
VIKRNGSFGSFGLEIGAGIYQNKSDNPTYGDSALRLIPIRLGAALFLDTLGPEPIVVPYIAGGAYTISFREELGGNSHNGNTQVAGYVHAGLAFQLDWIDRKAARVSFQDSGIQSTFIYLEGQNYMKSGNVQDGDFSSDINYAAGFRVEF